MGMIGGYEPTCGIIRGDCAEGLKPGGILGGGEPTIMGGDDEFTYV